MLYGFGKPSKPPGLWVLIHLCCLYQGFCKTLVSYNTERGKALGKSAMQKGVLIKGSVVQSETGETKPSPFRSPALTSRSPGKVWALSTGDLFVSSARLRFQTWKEGLARRKTGLVIR